MESVHWSQPLPPFYTYTSLYFCCRYFLSCFLLPFLYLDECEIHPLKSVYVSLFFFLFVWAFFLLYVYGCNFWKSYERKSWRQALVLVIPQRVRSVLCYAIKHFHYMWIFIFNKIILTFASVCIVFKMKYLLWEKGKVVFIFGVIYGSWIQPIKYVAYMKNHSKLWDIIKSNASFIIIDASFIIPSCRVACIVGLLSWFYSQ